MNEKKYNRWWQLHLRVARGEALNPQEQDQYEAGLQAMDEEEKEQFQSAGIIALRQLRTQIEQLRNLHAELVNESNHLDERIVTLEQSYQQLTGYQLAI